MAFTCGILGWRRSRPLNLFSPFMSQYLLTISDAEDAFVRKLLQKLPGVRIEKVKPKAKAPKKPLTPEQQEGGKTS